MTEPAQHYSIVVGDVESFGRRTDTAQERVRKHMHTYTHAALSLLGLDPAEPRATSDRGDGFFWLLPGGVDKVALTGRFVDGLHARLRDHNRTVPDDAFRMRFSLHYGQVAWDGEGWVGTDLNSACRLVDIAPLRAALKAATSAHLAVAVSDSWYDAVVRHDHPEVDPSGYRRVPFDAKEIQGRHAWIRVPGYDFPPGIDEFVSAPIGGAGPDKEPRGATARAASSTRSSEVKIDRVGAYFDGDQINHGAWSINMGNGAD